MGNFSQWPLLLIDVTTEQGITGHGYLAPYLNRATAGLRTVLSDLGATLQAAAIADVTGLPMSSHLYPEVSGHLLRVTPSRGWLEWQDWAHPVLARPFEVRSGELHVPDVAGNGLAWDESAVTHYLADL